MKPMDAISSGIPVWALVALSVVVVQLTIDVIALLDLYRRPVEQVFSATSGFGRSWWDIRPRAFGVPFSLVFEVVDFLMMRKHLLGLRSRATAAERPSVSLPSCARATGRRSMGCVSRVPFWRT